MSLIFHSSFNVENSSNSTDLSNAQQKSPSSLGWDLRHDRNVFRSGASNYCEVGLRDHLQEDFWRAG